jgi:hypothetical protein
MLAMSESFVDLSYRGLALGKRIKLTQVRSASGYLEMPGPMPVGTTIAIATGDGVELEALVAESHEQVGGSDQLPGMLVRPTLEGAGEAWWNARVIPDAVPSAPLDDGRTAVMEAVSVPEEAVVAEAPVEDEAKRTVAMDAVDLAALGLTSVSQEMPAVAPDEVAAADEEPSEPKPGDSVTGKSKKKRKKR